MKRRFVVFRSIVIAASLLLFHQRFALPAKPPAPALKAAPHQSRPYYPGHLLVKFKPEIKNPGVDSRARALMSVYQLLDLQPLFPQARDQQ